MDKLRAMATRIAVRADQAWRNLRTRFSPSLPPDQGHRERGQGLAEYALILAGIAIVAIASLAFLGGTISELFWDPISEDFGEILSNLGI